MSKSNYKKAQKSISISILGNLFLSIIKILSGVFGQSYALVADGIESLTDFVSSVLVFFGIKYANKPADEDHPYGHGKAEPLMTFLVVILLIVAAVIIIYQSVINIQLSREAPKPFTLYVLGAIILLKEFLFQYVSKTGKKTKSTILIADAWHHRSDAITSLAAFIGIALALYMGKGWESADDWAAIVAGLIIFYNAYRIFRPALSEIMDEHIYDDFIEEIRTIACKVEGVKDTEKCFIRKHGMRFIVDLHLIVSGEISVKKGHDIAHEVKDKLKLKHPEIADVLIHVEPFKKDKN